MKSICCADQLNPPLRILIPKMEQNWTTYCTDLVVEVDGKVELQPALMGPTLRDAAASIYAVAATGR
jgi:hypothetical protein